jgi:hypothetical protein
MKKNMIILLLVLAATTALVQPAAAQANPARKVLFTLNQGEVIHQSAYIADASLNGYKFAAVLHNAQTDEYTFVFNGKRIFITGEPLNEAYPIEIHYLNPNEANGYVYAYRTDGRCFINERGKVSRLEEDKGSTYIENYNKGNFTYTCGRSFYARINGKTLGPYKFLGDASIAGNGNFGFAYEEKDGEWYARINDKTWGPYKDVRTVSVAGNGNFGFTYEDKNGKSYVRINDKTLGPYTIPTHVSVADNGNFGFAYEEKGGEWYARINDKTWGPYKGVWSVSVAGNGNFGFAYVDKDIKYYVRINGKTWGPYNDVGDVSVAGNGNFSFSYDGRYKNINGEDVAEPLSPFSHAFRTAAFSSDWQHDFYSDLRYEYVVIYRQKVGQSMKLRVWYNKQNHSFVWNAIEERELVVYEYKL